MAESQPGMVGGCQKNLGSIARQAQGLTQCSDGWCCYCDSNQFRKMSMVSHDCVTDATRACCRIAYATRQHARVASATQACETVRINGQTCPVRRPWFLCQLSVAMVFAKVFKFCYIIRSREGFREGFKFYYIICGSDPNSSLSTFSGYEFSVSAGALHGNISFSDIS